MICEKRKREIEFLARDLWEKKYRYVRGKDLEIWLEAEKQVITKYWQLARAEVKRRKQKEQAMKWWCYIFSFRWLIDYLEG